MWSVRFCVYLSILNLQSLVDLTGEAALKWKASFWFCLLYFYLVRYTCYPLMSAQSLNKYSITLTFSHGIDSAGHFLYYPDGIMITLSLILMETMRFFIFFLVCYYFTKKAVGLLTDAGSWKCSLKLILALNIAWCCAASLGNFLAYSFAW